jgi:hypothetical protein
VLGCGPAFGDEIEHRQEKQRFVRTLMPLGSAPYHPDTEMVKSFDSLLKGAFVGRHRQKVSSWELRARGRGDLETWRLGAETDSCLCLLLGYNPELWH